MKKKPKSIALAVVKKGDSLPIELIPILLLLAALLVFAANAKAEIAYDDYAKVLSMYVDGQGGVDYAALKANSAPLDAFLSKLETETIDSYPNNMKIAFWINAYNAYTLKAIIDHYPVESIKKIPGVWDKMKWKVAGRSLTLNDIEHEILRKQFTEPRIHFALVCAAIGCPALRREPYSGAALSAQLEDQTRRFLSVTTNFRMEGDTVHLSSIFDWFGQDFAAGFKEKGTVQGYSEKEQSVLNFISTYLDKATRTRLSRSKFVIQYTNYDWALNDKK